jgi:DNA replication protein DnaC
MNVKCQACEKTFTAEEIEINGKKICFVTMCDPCMEKRITEAEANAEQSRKDSLERDFWASVPPLYRETDLGRLNADLARQVLGWEYSPKGIGIRGRSGSQKTRCAVALLLKIKMKGKSVYFLKATDISKYAASQFSNEKEMQSEAHRAIRSAHTCQLLLIDDIGKGRLSPAAEELLYDILDKRSEKQLPIIWTANSTAEQLHDMMSPDRGDAIMRRLGEFTNVISI